MYSFKKANKGSFAQPFLFSRRVTMNLFNERFFAHFRLLQSGKKVPVQGNCAILTHQEAIKPVNNSWLHDVAEALKKTASSWWIANCFKYQLKFTHKDTFMVEAFMKTDGISVKLLYLPEFPGEIE